MWLAYPKARLSFKGTGYFVLETGNKTTVATDVAQREGLGFNLLWATVVPALYIHTVSTAEEIGASAWTGVHIAV